MRTRYHLRIGLTALTLMAGAVGLAELNSAAPSAPVVLATAYPGQPCSSEGAVDRDTHDRIMFCRKTLQGANAGQLTWQYP